MDIMNERLIAAVKKRPELYDKCDDNYANRSHLNREWKHIGSELGMDGSIARRKWTNLRDYFCRCVKMLTMPLTTTADSNSVTSERKKKWYLYDSMMFILPHVCNGNKSLFHNLDSDADEDHVSQLSEESQPGSPFSSAETATTSLTMHCEPGTSPLEVVGEPVIITTSSDENAMSGSIYSNSSFTRKRKLAKCYQDNEDETETVLSLDGDGDNVVVPHSHSHSSVKAMRRRPPAATEDIRDDVDLFVQSLAPSMRTLDRLSRIECQAEMQLLLLRFMRGLHHNQANDGDERRGGHNHPCRQSAESVSRPKVENQQ